MWKQHFRLTQCVNIHTPMRTLLWQQFYQFQFPLSLENHVWYLELAGYFEDKKVWEASDFKMKACQLSFKEQLVDKSRYKTAIEKLTFILH